MLGGSLEFQFDSPSAEHLGDGKSACSSLAVKEAYWISRPQTQHHGKVVGFVAF